MTEGQILKLKNIILYILNEFSGGIDYIKLYKILYFANKQQLTLTGIPIVHDNFKAWDYGPVPSFTGTLVKCFEENAPLKGDMKVFDGVLKVRKNKRVSSLVSPDAASIHPYTQQLLNNIIKKYKYTKSSQLSKESHDLAWYEAYHVKGGKFNGHTTINPISVARYANAEADVLDVLSSLYGKNAAYYNIADKDGVLDKYEETVIEINALMQMPEDWDGDGAYPIAHITGYNAIRILSQHRALIKLLDMVYPTPTGNIGIDWLNSKGKVSVEVSKGHIAFYYVSSDRQEVYDSPVLKFDDSAVEQLYEALEKLEQ